MSTRAALAAAVLAALAVAAAPAAAPAPEGFVMPSRNIACLAFGGTLRCDILSGLRPEPAGRCELDWTGLSLGRTGRARPTCAGDTVFDPRSPVLAYGRTWRRGGFTCLSRRTGLRCSNRSGRGFTLARQSWHRF